MRRWIVTFFGSGLLPGAPGTWASLLASAILCAVFILASPAPLAWNGILVAGMAICSVLAVALGPWAIAYFHDKDPGPFVLDEAAGICLTLVAVPIRDGKASLATFAVAFIAFRIFDVFKPPPARQLEKLPAGWGILLDDLAAAVYANLLCQVAIRFAWRHL